MLGIVDAGGGLRGIYGAGVLDCFLDKGIRFDYHLGVSTGALNLAAYISEQRMFAYRAYTELPFKEGNLSLCRWLRNGSYIDWAAFDRISGDALWESANTIAARRLTICATEAISGKPEYFHGERLNVSLMSVMKASFCPPVASDPCFVDSIPYFSGSLSDPIPIERAFSEGCDRVVLILGFPIIDIFDFKPPKCCERRISERYPGTISAVRQFAENYSNSLKRALEYEREKRILILAPRENYSMRNYYTKDLLSMRLLYSDGRRDARGIVSSLMEESGTKR